MQVRQVIVLASGSGRFFNGVFMKEHKPVTRKLSELSEYEANSRKHSPEQIQQLVNSINEFGFTNPILIDENNIIIAGHARAEAAAYMQLEKVPCMLISGLTQSQKSALVIADNKIALNSTWDYDALRAEIGFLKETDYEVANLGFSEMEIAELFEFGEKSDEVQPSVVFGEEVDEASNYIVLVFKNELDWLSAQTHFNLESVHSKRANGKPWSKGIGRVVDGANYLTRLHDDD